MGAFNRWLITVLSPPVSKKYENSIFPEFDVDSQMPLNPPSGGPTETRPIPPSSSNNEDSENYKKLLEEIQRDKVAVYSIHVLTPGNEDGVFSFEFFLVKNLNIGEEQAVNFRALIHNKRVLTKTPSENQPQITDYPPMLDGENLIQYIERVEKLPHMEWNDIYFDETMTVRYRGRVVYRYDEDKGTYEYLRGDKLSVKESSEKIEDKSSVVSLRPIPKDS